MGPPRTHSADRCADGADGDTGLRWIAMGTAAGSRSPGRSRGPSSHGRLVRREALFEQLSAGPNDCVVLVCAPAGSGKTMLVRSWLEDSGAL